jgi:hypothetical protein
VNFHFFFCYFAGPRGGVVEQKLRMSNAIFFYYYSKADDLAEGGEEKKG